MQPHPRFLLQGAHDAEEILGARVAVRGEHSVQAFAGLLDLRGQLLEADRGVDQIAQNGLARGRVASEIRIDRLRKERLAKARVALRARRDRGLEIPCESHVAAITYSNVNVTIYASLAQSMKQHFLFLHGYAITHVGHHAEGKDKTYSIAFPEMCRLKRSSAAWEARYRIPSRSPLNRWDRTTAVLLSARARYTRPTGFSFVPPVGPAMPVTARPRSAPLSSRTPSAMAWATSPLTAPFARMSASGTFNRSTLARSLYVTTPRSK